MVQAVLTREHVEAYAVALAPLGVEVTAMPITRIEQTDAHFEAVARALAGGPFAAIAIASRNAAIVPAGTRDVWAVGPATQTALEQRGVAAQVPAGVHDGAGLARAIIAAQDLHGARVLVPRAKHGRTELVELLRAAGADVVEVTAYETLMVSPADPTVRAGAEQLRSGALCVVFAPSQVGALHMCYGPLADTTFVAIGETTAAALRDLGITNVHVAASPTPDGLAQTVRAMLGPA